MALVVLCVSLALGGCRRQAASPASEAENLAAQREAKAHVELAAALPETYWDGKVVLGSPRLTSGIPGEGPLTIDEIRAWLDQEENHRTLQLALPLGLREAADKMQIPPDNPLTRAKIELGRQLFFDRRLSAENRFSCGQCHHPRDHFAHPGHNRADTKEIARTVPPIFNRILSTRQFWDGRAETLEDQALMPIEADSEMHNPRDDCVAALSKIEGYRLQFAKIFGGVTIEGVAWSLAAFERTIVTGPAPVDYVQLVQRLEARDPTELTLPEQIELEEARAGAATHPLSESARRGWALFTSPRVGCAVCHSGPNFTDEQYHNIGIGQGEEPADYGRFLVSGKEEDRGAFKTPTLRCVARTAPYMHRGQLGSLEEVVEWYNKPPAEVKLSPRLRPLGLTSAEKSDLVEFLRSCTGPLPPVETGRLPP